MDADEASENLKVIRQLMERPIRFSTMSGLSAILAGAAALAGLAADWHVWCSYDRRTAMWLNLAVWGGVFVVAFAATMILTRLRERKQGMPSWSRIKKRILLTILPPFAAGAGLTAAIMYRWYTGDGPNEWGLIPAVWMLFYGVALWQLGEFSPIEVRLLGAAFLAAGLISAARYQSFPYSYWTLGLTFGGFHIVYGIIVWVRHGG
jgi:hypothetical protein